MPATYNYNVNPAPRTGQGPYGQVPGQLQLPSPASDLSRQYPNLGRTNAALSGDILSGLEGQLAPGTQRDLQDFNAAWGVNSGMPGSGLATNRLGRNLGLASQQLINTAIGQYNQTVPTISGTQTVNPALQTQIATQNSLNAAAPDPTAAASHAEQLYQRYLQQLSGPAGGLQRNNMSGGGYSQPRPWWEQSQISDPGMDVGQSTGQGVTFGNQVYYDNPTPGQGWSANRRDPWMDQWNADWARSSPQGSLGNADLTDEDLDYFGVI